MTVRAKFKVESVQRQNDAEGKPTGATVMLCPVYDSDPNSENGKFFRWTPWGRIEIGTLNMAAAEQFKPGAEVYVDFTPIG